MASIRDHPSLADAHDLVSTGLARDDLITVVGRCAVDYDGRATSDLAPGERHLMLKPDGTTLVHTDDGQKPVNWQPPGTEQTTWQEEDTLVIESTRQSPEERLTVVFESITMAARFDPDDDRDLTLEGTEADLKERILQHPEVIEPGFQPLATERETSAGAVDIYGEDADGATVVLELKRRRVGPDAVGQLNRYVEALDRDLHTTATIRGILVAPSITDRAHRLLAENGLEYVSLSP